MSSTISALLAVGVVGLKEPSERLVIRAPQRLSKVVTSTVVGSEVGARWTRDVHRVRTLEWVQLRRGGRVFLQYIGQMSHQLFHFGFRQRIAKRTIR